MRHFTYERRLDKNISRIEISFLYDDSIAARVLNGKNRVEFEGVKYSVTGLAIKILTERFGWSDSIHINGWRYFTKDGITLSDMRGIIESADPESD